MGVTSPTFIQLNINKNIMMNIPELVDELNNLAYEHNACAAQFRGWLVGNDIPFTEEFGCVEDGEVYEDGDFILDAHPEFGFNFEDANEGEFFTIKQFEV
jgi:hypothetical protein